MSQRRSSVAEATPKIRTMKLTAVISCIVAILSLILSSCAKEFTNTFATSVLTTQCQDKLHSLNSDKSYTNFDMSIADGKAKCVLHGIRVQEGFKEDIVKVKASQDVVKVILEYDYPLLYCGCDCFHTVLFTLEDLPEGIFRFEVYSEYKYDDPYSQTGRYKNPHIRQMIYPNDPENSNLVLRFERDPD